MTKQEVLEFFARKGDFVPPDELWLHLQRKLDRRSVYSYLLRLKRQGLLEPGQKRGRGQLVYRITERGRARLRYFRSL
jgi:DNA-binding PadR family transcriptional regulator